MIFRWKLRWEASTVESCLIILVCLNYSFVGMSFMLAAGALRYIRTLKPWPLKRVMVEKYLFVEADSAALCNFLLPMLAMDKRKRTHARDMIHHEWLNLTSGDDVVGE